VVGAVAVPTRDAAVVTVVQEAGATVIAVDADGTIMAAGVMIQSAEAIARRVMKPVRRRSKGRSKKHAAQ
jgi:hypothetical protein